MILVACARGLRNDGVVEGSSSFQSSARDPVDVIDTFVVQACEHLPPR